VTCRWIRQPVQARRPTGIGSQKEMSRYRSVPMRAVSALIPITPGGLGFVDAGLTALLVVIGISADTALIGTLLYRLISFWLPIPVGLLAWTGWRIHLHITRPSRTKAPEPPAAGDD